MIKRPRLINDARLWWRFWSNRLVLVGNAIAAFLLLIPDSALFVWNSLPQDIKNAIPPEYLPIIGIGISSTALIARQMKQAKLERLKRIEPR